MTRDEEAELIVEVERAQSQLRTSLKKSRALIAEYRAKLGNPADPKVKAPLFRFGRGR